MTNCSKQIDIDHFKHCIIQAKKLYENNLIINAIIPHLEILINKSPDNSPRIKVHTQLIEKLEKYRKLFEKIAYKKQYDLDPNSPRNIKLLQLERNFHKFVKKLTTRPKSTRK